MRACPIGHMLSSPLHGSRHAPQRVPQSHQHGHLHWKCRRGAGVSPSPPSIPPFWAFLWPQAGGIGRALSGRSRWEFARGSPKASWAATPPPRPIVPSTSPCLAEHGHGRDGLAGRHHRHLPGSGADHVRGGHACLHQSADRDPLHSGNRAANTRPAPLWQTPCRRPGIDCGGDAALQRPREGLGHRWRYGTLAP